MNYDKLKRDPQARKFYNSAAWKRCRASKLAETPWCEYISPGQVQICGQLAQHVHHLKPIATPAGWKNRLDHAGLQSLCIPCHNKAEADGEQLPFVAGTLDLAENDRYYFDHAAGDRPIRFIEKFCRHYEGKFDGQPFLLDPVQKKIIFEIFATKCRDTGLRRFTQVWFEAAAGAGKSPLLAALGLYCLMEDGEAAAQVFSQASDKIQARVVFTTAKTFVEQSPELSARLIVRQNSITHPASKSVWELIAGVGRKSGMRPSMVLGDEVHEWQNREVYDALQSRMTKRSQPIYFLATNAGENRNSFAWVMHEEAVGVLAGTRKNEALYPIIWAAPMSMKIDDPDAWRMANQLLGITVKESKVAAECERAQGDPSLEARFRRLFMTQWVQGASKWLDLVVWEAACAPIDLELLKDAPLYVGIDLSLVDDLSAVVYLWITPDRWYVDADFWVPKVTADRYELKECVPYSKWSAAGAIELLEQSTISVAVRKRIAARIVEKKQLFNLQAACFDPYKDDDCTQALKAEGIRCVEIRQGWSVSQGCAEVDRRLKEKSLTISPNPVLKSNAEVVEVMHDARGNFWPVKPNAKGKYAGKRSAKIDGIAALVTVATEARKHNFPASDKKWKGEVLVL